MVTYIIYTNKSGSFIVPKEKAKLPKEFEGVSRPLLAPVNTAEDVQGVLMRLFEAKKDGNSTEKVS